MKKSFIKRLMALALVIVSIFCMSAVAVAEYETMYINCKEGETVRLREGPSTSYGVLTTIRYGTAVQAESYDSNWYRVKYNGYNGYMMSDFLSPTHPSQGGTTVSSAYINKNAVNIREYPNTGSQRLGRVNANTTLEVLGEAEGESLDGSTTWLYVKILKCSAGSASQINGKIGYVHSSFVSGYTPGSNSSEHPKDMYDAFGFSTLKYGSKGNYVKNVQLALREGGYLANSENIDGIYGAKTTAAVEAFQTEFDYLLAENEYDDPADGLVGPKTKKVLWDEYGSYLKEHGVM